MEQERESMPAAEPDPDVAADRAQRNTEPEWETERATAAPGQFDVEEDASEGG